MVAGKQDIKIAGDQDIGIYKKQNPDDGHRGLLLTNYKPKL